MAQYTLLSLVDRQIYLDFLQDLILLKVRSDVPKTSGQQEDFKVYLIAPNR